MKTTVILIVLIVAGAIVCTESPLDYIDKNTTEALFLDAYNASLDLSDSFADLSNMNISSMTFFAVSLYIETVPCDTISCYLIDQQT